MSLRLVAGQVDYLDAQIVLHVLLANMHPRLIRLLLGVLMEVLQPQNAKYDPQRVSVVATDFSLSFVYSILSTFLVTSLTTCAVVMLYTYALKTSSAHFMEVKQLHNDTVARVVRHEQEARQREQEARRGRREARQRRHEYVLYLSRLAHRLD